jgi:hypothetical protein
MENKEKNKAELLEQALSDLKERKQAVAELAEKTAPQRQKFAALMKELDGLPQFERREVLNAAGLQHISAAPRPIIPVKSNSVIRVTPRPTESTKLKLEARLLDWDFWLNMPAVKAWQACALSLNIDPDAMHHSANSWMAGPSNGPVFELESFPTAEAKELYEKRLRMLSVSVGSKTHFRLHSITMGEPAQCQIYLCDFAKWAGSVVHWRDMPSQLTSLIQANEPAEVSVLTVKVDANPHISGEVTKDWAKAARAIAKEYITRHKARDLFPSQADVCRHLESELRSRKHYGPHGTPLSKTTILREAIQGDWWQANKP